MKSFINGINVVDKDM